MHVEPGDKDQLVFTHDGIASARPMMLIVIGCIAVVAIATLLGGARLALVIVLIVGGFLLAMLDRSSAMSEAVFDRGRGSLVIIHSRRGRVVGRDEVALADITDVIVDAATGTSSTRADQRLSLRPAVVAGDKIVPLTYRAFESGERPLEAAVQIRAFLGRAGGDLITDSVRALACHSERIQPAVRLARLGLGLNRVEAGDMVMRLRQNR